MNHETILDSLGRLPEEVIESVDAVRTRKKPNPVWLKWGALAACLCVAVLLTVPLLRQTGQTPSVNGDKFSPTPGSSIPGEAPADGEGSTEPTPGDTPDSADPGCPKPMHIVNGRRFDTTSYSISEVLETLPEGFSYAGRLENGNRYYTNPDIPEWIYVFQQLHTRYKRDPETNEWVPDYKYCYVRWVDTRLARRDLLCYKGEYYISLQSARPDYYYIEDPDITEEYYNAMFRVYGDTRVEEDPKYGFELIGQTTFAGHDTVPKGDLACNFGVRNVYKSGVTDLLLVSNAWVSWTSDGKKVCRGYDVYVRYDCPFAEPGDE